MASLSSDCLRHVTADSLENISLKFICGNIEKLCYEIQKPFGNFKKLSFKVPVFLHEQLAEKILRRLACSGKLTLDILTLFLDKSTCRLKRACIQSSDIKKIGLELLLKNHSINDLDLRGTWINFENLILSSLGGSASTYNLKRLIISNARNALGISTICSFKSLVYLDISKNILSDFDLKKICDSLDNLEELDISCTAISDANSFSSAKTRLKCLKAYNCPVAWNNPIDFVQFTALRHLDISRNPGTPQGYDWPRDAEKLEMLLMDTEALKELEVLDVSGTPRIMDKPLLAFMSCHPKLMFLGLCKTGLTCYADFLPKDIEITGEATEQQIMSSLHHYPDRESYMTESLRRLFNISKNWTEQKFDVLKLVLTPMEMHPNEIRLQMAATACVFNLTRNLQNDGDLHPSILGKVASLVLKAMDAFPRKLDLIRNCLLILDCKPLMKTARFDFYKGCQLAMDALCYFVNDVNIARLATRVCAILTAKISNSETVALGTERNIKTLLKVVQEKTDAKLADTHLVLVLSVLWNLTDEAPGSCQLFLDCQGLTLFVKVIKEFAKENFKIAKKVLGTMNNVAEVEALRSYLITDEYIGLLSEMLDAGDIQVSYFAGGILANIALSWDPEIPVTPNKNDTIKKLEESVLRWPLTEQEMVAYRSFKPFIPLLKSDISAVQLWATWAILHVCMKNDARYVPLLVNDDIQDIIRILSIQEHQHAILKDLCEQVCKKTNEYLKGKNM